MILFIFTLVTFTDNLSEILSCMFYSYVPLTVSYGFIVFEAIHIIVYPYTTHVI